MEEMNYENMSYEERRQWNISRNESILAMLFEGEKPLSHEVKQQETNIYEEYLRSNASLSVDYICRETEVQRIREFLDKDVFQLPQLLIYGPSGTGKTSICSDIVSSIKYSPSVLFSCKKAATAAKFWLLLWQNICSAMCAFHHINSADWRALIQQRSITTIPTVRNLADFITLIRIALVTHSQIVSQHYTVLQRKPPLCLQSLIVVFDDVDVTEQFESGFADKLLQLDAMIDMKLLKIICIRRTLPRNMQYCMLLHFAPYTDKQLIRIASNTQCKKNSDKNDKNDSTLNVEQLATSLVPEITLTTRHVASVVSTISQVCKQPTEHPVEIYRAYEQLPVPEVLSLSNMTASTDGMKKMIAALPVSTDTLRGKGWCADLPAMARLLLISAFIALRSHHRNDKYTFGTVAKGRRKRSVDEEEEVSAETEAAKSFTSERLLKIFNHLSQAHPQKNVSLLPQQVDPHHWSGYSVFKDKAAVLECGSVYHMIATLVRRGLLVEVSTSGIYSTSVTDEMAEMLARSLGIPLHNYMYA